MLFITLHCLACLPGHFTPPVMRLEGGVSQFHFAPEFDFLISAAFHANEPVEITEHFDMSQMPHSHFDILSSSQFRKEQVCRLKNEKDDMNA